MRLGVAVVALAAGAVLAASLAQAQEPPSPTPAPQQPQPPPDPRAILDGVCSSCHGVDFITERRKSRDDWEFTVRRMIDKGAEIGPDDAALLIDYLARTYPPASPEPKAPGP